MPNHKLSKNICPVKDPCRSSVDHDVATFLTVLKYTKMMILLSLLKLPLLLFKGQKVPTPRHIAEEPNSQLFRSISKFA
jgi:hypothetical protein